MILITREEDKSSVLSNKFKEMGFESLVHPLFEVVNSKSGFLRNLLFKFSKPQAILVTSANVAPFLASSSIDRNIRIFAIGDQTAKSLRKSGFRNIKKAFNSSGSLLSLTLKNLKKENGLVLYLSGEVITQDLALSLQKKGFKAKRIICYKTNPVEKLSDQVIEKIKSGKITQVVLYSQNTAKIFHELLNKHGLFAGSKTIKLLCFSDKIVTFCRNLGFQNCQNLNQTLV